MIGLRISAAAFRNSFTVRGMDKLLRSYIPQEKYSNCDQLRDKVKRYYLNGVDTTNKLAVAKAYEEVCFYLLNESRLRHSGALNQIFMGIMVKPMIKGTDLAGVP